MHTSMSIPPLPANSSMLATRSFALRQSVTNMCPVHPSTSLICFTTASVTSSPTMSTTATAEHPARASAMAIPRPNPLRAPVTCFEWRNGQCTQCVCAMCTWHSLTHVHGQRGTCTHVSAVSSHWLWHSGATHVHDIRTCTHVSAGCSTVPIELKQRVTRKREKPHSHKHDEMSHGGDVNDSITQFDHSTDDSLKHIEGYQPTSLQRVTLVFTMASTRPNNNQQNSRKRTQYSDSI